MNGISISEKPTHQVDIKDGKVVITTQVEAKLVLLQHYQQLDVRTPPALFYTVKYENTIDMSKGVDQDGYPLVLQTKISFVKKKPVTNQNFVNFIWLVFGRGRLKRSF